MVQVLLIQVELVASDVQLLSHSEQFAWLKMENTKVAFEHALVIQVVAVFFVQLKEYASQFVCSY